MKEKGDYRHKERKSWTGKSGCLRGESWCFFYSNGCYEKDKRGKEYDDPFGVKQTQINSFPP
jgi:hypothetical protein